MILMSLGRNYNFKKQCFYVSSNWFGYFVVLDERSLPNLSILKLHK